MNLLKSPLTLLDILAYNVVCTIMVYYALLCFFCAMHLMT